MKFLCFWLAFGMVCQPSLSQKPFTKEEVTKFLEHLEAGHSQAVLKKLQSQNIDAYDFGIRILFSRSSDDALRWFANLTKATNDPTFFYGKAYTHYVRGEIAQAVKDAKFLLNSSQTTKLILARTHYLLGLISHEQFDLQAAEQELTAALSLYRQLGKNGGMYLGNMELAWIHARQQDVVRARAYKEKALEFNSKLKSPYSPGRAYQLESECYFQQGDYPNALKYTQMAITVFRENGSHERAMWEEVRQGLFQALTGDFGVAWDIASKFDKKAVDDNLPKLNAYNSLTWIYLYRCKGLDSKVLRQDVTTWAKSARDGKLVLNLLAFVERVSCPESR